MKIVTSRVSGFWNIAVYGKLILCKFCLLYLHFNEYLTVNSAGNFGGHLCDTFLLLVYISMDRCRRFFLCFAF